MCRGCLLIVPLRFGRRLMASERLRARLEWRRSNAAVPHRNRYRERGAGQDGADWLTEWEAERDVSEPRELGWGLADWPG